MYDMNRKRRDFDCFKYAKPDPTNNVVFFGPITKRELLRAVEVDKEVALKRLAKKKAEADENKNFESDHLRQEGKKDNALDRTFEISASKDGEEQMSGVFQSDEQQPQSTVNHRALNDVTQLHHNHEEAQLLDLSVRFTRTSMKPPNSKPVRNLLDETVNFNESKSTARLPTPLPDKMSKHIAPRKRSSMMSKEKKEETVDETPSLIADMVGDNILNATIPDDADLSSQTSERVGTPDIFRRRQNEKWDGSSETKQSDGTRLFQRNSSVKKSALLFSRSPAVTKGTKLPIIMRTPTRNQRLFPKSPSAQKSASETSSSAVKDSKPLFLKSPVAAYIRGSEFQSMSSKSRHNACFGADDRRSKSDSKGVRKCRIPVPMGGTVKKKLDLVE